MTAALRAALPPALPGLDPRWSRLITVTDADGLPHTWHVLDTAAPASASGADLGRGFGTSNGNMPLLVPKPERLAQVGTLLCVHGNPTWSYLWRHVIAAAPPGWRVVAVDQLGMGYSDRLTSIRRLGQRIDDLSRLTDALGITGPGVTGPGETGPGFARPVVTVAHDWGGAISLGWALAHRAQVAGIVLTNTAVHQPAGSRIPGLIRLAAAPGLRQLICQVTPAFVLTAGLLSRPALPRAVRAGLSAPYDSCRRRTAVADFVADIPLDDGHPSAAALAAIVDGLPTLADVPALLMWGPRDPVFADRYLRDLMARLPQADVHRFEGAGHLVTEDRPETGDVIGRWVHNVVADPSHTDRAKSGVVTTPDAARSVVGAALAERASDDSPAVVEMGPAGPGRTITFAQLATRVEHLATGLQRHGVRPGHRVALLVPPGIDLTLAVYACWRIGAVIVVADAGLGLRKLGRALRGAGPDHLIGIGAGLAAARGLRIPGHRIAAGEPGSRAAALFGAATTLDDLITVGAAADAAVDAAVGATMDDTAAGHRPPPPGPDEECAAVFTSGATGPPKGVVYLHRQVEAQIALLTATYDIGPQDRLVAAFAPFALYGPALGIASAVPAMDVTAPATLTARALAEAIDAVAATVVFASPAALRNVVATAADLDARQRRTLLGPRLLMSAGAPVPAALLRAVQGLLPNAELHTPYGMTEVLPVTDVTLAQIETAQIETAQNETAQNETAQNETAQNETAQSETAHNETAPNQTAGKGVCVGTPVAGVVVGISPLGPDGHADAPPGHEPDVTGEVCVRAAHGKQRYDRLWATEFVSSRDHGFHRTGDVGHLDRAGRLWIEGRLVDVITTLAGPASPVPLEQRIEALPGVRAAAVVGVGPAGIQQIVAVVVFERADGARRPGTHLTLAPDALADQVRAAANHAGAMTLAAVLTTDRLPVDIRHNSKIDHARLARAAGNVLAGRRGSRRRRTGR